VGDVTQRDLAQYDDAWGESEEPTGGGSFEPWPNGKYHGVTVVSAELKKTKTGKPMVTFAYQKAEGGSWQFDNNVITGDVTQLGYLKKKLRVFGCPIQRLSDLPDRLRELVGSEVSVQVVTKDVGDKTFTNVYALDEPGGGTPQTDDDDIPF